MINKDIKPILNVLRYLTIFKLDTKRHTLGRKYLTYKIQKSLQKSLQKKESFYSIIVNLFYI
jgi:hypothetical protein